MKPIRVQVGEIAEAPQSRLDVRYHMLTRLVTPFFENLVNALPLTDALGQIGNGVNLPASSYADELSDGSALYASVKSLSQFALREASCVPLLADKGKLQGSRLSIEDVAVGPGDVLLTRSGTPGIAWPAAFAPDGLPVVPSGFLIRLSVSDDWDPTCVAAILNHPCWRLLTLALSAGKRQDNIGQSSLASIPLPRLNAVQQAEIAKSYGQTLNRIEKVLADEPLTQVCDTILSKALRIGAPPVETRQVSVSVIKLSEVASTPSLRADNRWHGSANRLIRSALLDQSVTIGDLVSGLPTKGRQPQFVDDESDEEAFAIATSTLQAGQIAMDYAKPVTVMSAIRFPVAPGDLLVAMDGDGSLGKAGVVGPSEVKLTADSHVAVVPVRGDIELKLALACWLNSTWGRTQTTGLMTGATGQTQLRPSDLLRVLVPRTLVKEAGAVANAYRKTLTTFEPPARRARQLICDGAELITTLLIESGTLHANNGIAAEFGNPSSLRAFLDLAYPVASAF